MIFFRNRQANWHCMKFRYNISVQLQIREVQWVLTMVHKHAISDSILSILNLDIYLALFVKVARSGIKNAR